MAASVVFCGETAEKRSGPADHIHMSVSVGEAEDVGAVHKHSCENAEKRSGPADHMGVSVGEAGVDTAAHKLSSPPEHPRVTWLRHRRLIAFLRDQGFHDSYNELSNKTRAHMSLWHLRGLVEQGQWLDAVEYLDRYLPPPASPKSFGANVLRSFLLMHHRFANAVAGVVDKSVPRNYLQLDNRRDVSHADLRLRSISLSILAVDEVSLWSRRRYVKKKKTGRPKAIIMAMKRKQLMVPRIGSAEEAKELLADLLDETIRGGVQLNTYGLYCPVQPGTQFCQPMFGTTTEAKTSGTLANAGTDQHVIEAGCDTNTARQDLDGRRNSSEESTIFKLKRELKRQRLRGPFCLTSPVVSGSGTVVNLGAKLSGVSSE